MADAKKQQCRGQEAGCNGHHGGGDMAGGDQPDQEIAGYAGGPIAQQQPADPGSPHAGDRLQQWPDERECREMSCYQQQRHAEPELYAAAAQLFGEVAQLHRCHRG